MKVKYRYWIGYRKRIERFLKENGVNYRITYDNQEPIIIVFYLDEESKKELKKKSLLLRLFGDIFTEKEYEYSPEELMKCNYLLLFCNNIHGICILDADTSFSYSCYQKEIIGGNLFPKHKQQIKDFSIEKLPKRKNTYFFEDDGGAGYLFALKVVKDLLDKNEIAGIKYRNVYVGTEKTDEIYQIVGDEILNGGIMDFEYDSKKSTCKICGKEMIDLTSFYPPLCVYKKLTKDFYETDRIFQERVALYIVSQRLYRLLKDSKLDKGCAFVPVKEVEDVGKC